VCDILIGSIIKRKSMHANYGVAVLAEGLLEAIGEEGLVECMSTAQLGRYGQIVKDPFGHLRLGEIDLGQMIKDRLSARLEALGLSVSIIPKDLGYELRCADPIPFDAEYTRDLGYGAVKFLRSDEAAKFGAIISLVGGHLEPLPFEQMIDPQTRRMQTRRVNVKGEGYECARRYMIRLERRDFENPQRLARLASTAGMSPEQFRQRFEYIVEH
jgi:6-phosphofructokinase 1